MSIYKNLPNDLIMRIIREADGGLYTHKKKARMSIKEIQIVGSIYRMKWDECRSSERCGEECSPSRFLWTFTGLGKFTKYGSANATIRSRVPLLPQLLDLDDHWSWHDGDTPDEDCSSDSDWSSSDDDY